MADSAVSSTSARGVQIRRVLLSDSTLPSDYGTTPGGTLFSTTPGGTRIIYDRSFLLQCRNSPMAKSPPANLPKIPGVTCPLTDVSAARAQTNTTTASTTEPATEQKAPGQRDDQQFEMDI